MNPKMPPKPDDKILAESSSPNDAIAPASHGHSRPFHFREYHPSKDEIDALIGRASQHPLGIDFLRSGSLDAVAATFGVHAFVVEQARGALHAGATSADQASSAEVRTNPESPTRIA